MISNQLCDVRIYELLSNGNRRYQKMSIRSIRCHAMQSDVTRHATVGPYVWRRCQRAVRLRCQDMSVPLYV